MSALQRKLNNKFSDKLIEQYAKYLPSPRLHILEYLSNSLGIKGISYEQEKIEDKYGYWKKYMTPL